MNSMTEDEARRFVADLAFRGALPITIAVAIGALLGFPAYALAGGAICGTLYWLWRAKR